MPEEALVRPDSPPDSPSDSPPDKLIKALEAHVATLKEQLAAAEARLAAAAARDAQRADLAAERAQTEKAIAAFSAVSNCSTCSRPNGRSLGGDGWWAEVS